MNIAVVGAGAFATFSVKAFQKVPDVRCSGVFDTNTDRADKFAGQFGVKIYNSFELLLNDPEVDLVYIATPPFLHYKQSKTALLAGKHVICEKPAALLVEQVEEVLKIADTNNLLYVVNLMQRYNPLYQAINTIVQKKVLGECLHGFFENYASGESVHSDHWMWDENKSGGIFIEHAVHFFDMFEGWLGKGEVVASQKVRHSGFKEDYWTQVQSVVNYQGIPVTFYHGFNQPGRLDRQEIRLLFERGDISMYEWIPVVIRLHGLVNEEEFEILKVLFPEAEIKIVKRFQDKERNIRGHFSRYDVSCEIILENGKPEDKGSRYALLLERMMADQKGWIDQRAHQRIITGNNGLNSLKMAVASDKKAIKL